ncbi:hypothetical protein [Kocuria rhizophila]|uniref:hypothetical protein n=1 Tax=Kocuria rhizophila TaxID=72000 RepID=UPI00119F2C81|nr:hypothetical protein [Kocuria rhizophila]
MTTIPAPAHPTVATISPAGDLTLTRLAPAPAGHSWHHGLHLARHGAGTEFWTQPTPGDTNLSATELADALGAGRLTGLLTGPVLICGTGGTEDTPAPIPPLALALHTPITT